MKGLGGKSGDVEYNKNWIGLCISMNTSGIESCTRVLAFFSCYVEYGEQYKYTVGPLLPLGKRYIKTRKRSEYRKFPSVDYPGAPRL